MSQFPNNKPTPRLSTETEMEMVVSQAIQDQHQADLDDLIEAIKAVVKDYDFIGGVELEVAA